MTLTTNIAEPIFAGPPEPDLTPAEVIARAHAIAATLVDRQAETEQRTFYAEDTHEAFRDAGFYRILVPRRFGGYDFGIDTFMRVVQILTRACPSTGWMYCLGAAHAHVVGTLFEERVQEEAFAGGEFIAPATVMPSGDAVRTEGGWLLTGTWSYCSGIPYASHFVGHTLVSRAEGEPPEPMMFIVDSSQWTRLDDWGGQLGLKGSGSHSIVMENAFVADYQTIATHMSQVNVTEGTPGRRLHANPEYGGGPLSFMVLEDAVLAVGMAQGALDAYGDLMRSRTTMFPPIVGRAENEDFQFWYGEATGMIATAEAAFHQSIQTWRELCEQGPEAFTVEQELRIAVICREVVRLCWDAVQKYLFPTAGSSAVRQGQRIERVWRDLSMQHSHAGISIFLTTIAKRELTKLEFGVVDEH
ncbi:acyl-CoA dehydrogenase family protein [Actinokineospora xionganensis]|uniref:Acyl-CoA dehydrogenase n=1 Tax=Actinokineospora xionganensis TaxID=2684470 RepID=A0ABR7LDX3_9PSEU|nr:acyl-CoA dehydrogenase family protein [Actinokineospora xionganensis]MBC6450898.1 acyl-CoA dehydrogenase [Actinokineospora xionganensis]